MDRPLGRVLVVEDDSDTLQLIVEVLEEDGFQAQPCADGERALRLLKQEVFDLVLADIKMPRMTGTGLLFQIRNLGLDTKVILMTAYASLETAVQAVRGDASDYLVKPFSLKELRRQVRRALEMPTQPLRPRECLTFGDLVLDQDARKVWKCGREIPLTRLEFNVLDHLFRLQGQVVSVEELLQQNWPRQHANDRNPTVVKSCIFRLRQKIEDDPCHPVYVHNVWGRGYQFGE
ncbi:MAG: response regulator transcription factor [Anaerolineae bacterium]|nr:response regulator transcription factor [Anaerolineae bacterium]